MLLCSLALFTAVTNSQIFPEILFEYPLLDSVDSFYRAWGQVRATKRPERDRRFSSADYRYGGAVKHHISTDDEAFIFYDFPNCTARGICPSLKGMPHFGTITHNIYNVWIGGNEAIIPLFSTPSQRMLHQLPFEGAEILQRLIPNEAPTAVMAYTVERGRWTLLEIHISIITSQNVHGP